jgi:hypothetical protein
MPRKDRGVGKDDVGSYDLCLGALRLAWAFCPKRPLVIGRSGQHRTPVFHLLPWLVSGQAPERVTQSSRAEHRSHLSP